MSELSVVGRFRDDLLSSGAARRRRPRRRTAVVLVAAVVSVAGVATAATGAFPVGSPLAPFGGDATDRIGAPDRASDSVLAVRAADPDGGPPWGIRTFSTSAGWQCQQIGRVVDGRLGVIGGDGSFHALPLQAAGPCAGGGPAGRPGGGAAAPSAPIREGIGGAGALANLSASGAPAGGYVADCGDHPTPAEIGSGLCGGGERRYAFVGAVSGDVTRIELVGEGIHVELPVADGHFLAVLRGPPPRGTEVYAVFADGRRVRQDGVVLQP
jgi:hypothetical protein